LFFLQLIEKAEAREKERLKAEERKVQNDSLLTMVVDIASYCMWLQLNTINNIFTTSSLSRKLVK